MKKYFSDLPPDVRDIVNRYEQSVSDYTRAEMMLREAEKHMVECRHKLAEIIHK